MKHSRRETNMSATAFISQPCPTRSVFKWTRRPADERSEGAFPQPCPARSAFKWTRRPADGQNTLCAQQLARLLGRYQVSEPVILCIGTDRIIGDSLGPLTGSLLKKRAGEALHVYGTLEHTVHACNLAETLTQIQKSILTVL